MITVSFGFVVTVALFGVIVVFGLLIAMLGFMVGMQGVDRAIGKERTRGSGAPNHPRAAKPAARLQTSDWVVAAALAYLIHEEEEARPEASPWTNSRATRDDRWVDIGGPG